MAREPLREWVVGGSGISLYGALVGCRMAKYPSHAVKLVADGCITVNGAAVSRNVWCNSGDVIRLVWPRTVREQIARETAVGR